jgi:hypothetical protein
MMRFARAGRRPLTCTGWDYSKSKYSLERSLSGSSSFPLPLEYLHRALLALGTGLALLAYLEPGALPPELYSAIVGQLINAPPSAGGE